MAAQSDEQRRFLVSQAVTIIIAMVVAALGFIGARYAADRAYESAQRVEAERAEIEGRRIDREKRAEVYGEFLNATNEYYGRLSEFSVALQRELSTAEDADIDTIPADVTTAFGSAGLDFQSAINQLAIYGSSDAWAAHRPIADLLPPASAIRSDGAAKDALIRTLNDGVDDDALSDAYRDFRNIACRELPENPREDCTR